jgi:cation:H+ antiporter
MILNLLVLFIGMALLLGGGDLLVRGASALAKCLGVPSLVIGLTVVAFGTSAPELSINLLAVVKDNTDICFGNVIGSSIANIGLVIGVSALIKPLAVKGVIIKREIPMMVLASLLALTAGSDALLRKSQNLFDRTDGIIFLLIFGVVIYYTVNDVINKKNADFFIKEVEEQQERKNFKQTLLNLLILIVGLILLVFGGKLTVDGAVGIAEAMNIPKAIIGLTVVAIGTSLPELITAGMATWKGHTDIAIGSVAGSNLFNILLINGVCSTIRPIPVPVGGISDLLMMLFLSLFLLPLCITNKSRIVRWEGALLLLLYVGFSVWRVATG